MNIITRFTEFLANKIKQNTKTYFNNVYNCLNNNPYNFDCYKQFIEDLDKFNANLTIDAYQEFILLLDEEFMCSPTRIRDYNSKGFLTKTLLTKFGWINFKRRRYVSIETGKTFMYVDRLLGLEKYSRLDAFVIADLCEESASTSYANAGRILSKNIGTKIKYDNDITKNILSRATVRNNVQRATELLTEPTSSVAKETAELNIMIDEKYVGSQFNEGKDHMVKSAVVFEGYKCEYKNRIRLTGKKVFGSLEDDLLTTVMDYIYYNYDTDKLKKINIMGDGANWIKSFALDSSFKYHKDIIVKYGLDHFHMSQAIQQIVTNKHKEAFSPILTDYAISNKKADFITVVESIIKLEPSREETIRNKMDYILNNWEHIQTTFHDIKYKCSMESNISHVLADLFTARPRAYSKEGLKKLLKLRLLKTNGADIKKVYFESLKLKHKEIKEQEIENKFIVGNIKFNDSFYQGVSMMHNSKFEGAKLRKIINHSNYKILF